MMSHRSPVLKRVLHAMGLVPLLFSVICWPGLEASASEPATAEPATAELAAQRGVPKPEIFPVAPATPDVWSQEVEASEGGPGTGARGKPPPTLVDLVMHYVLIERDLDHARVLLADGLVNALNEVSNRAWTARLYALMAALEVLEGDQQNARRLALRAVTLEQGVRIEGELGERVEGTLRWAKRTWKKRKKSATIRASQLPHRLTLYLDGRVLETPQDIPLRPGDHLLQVVGTIGVVARGWLTLQEGALLEDPDPLGEVQRALLPPEDTAEPLAQEELEALVDDARSARQDTQALTAEVGMELTMARSSSRIERAACLAEQQHRLKRFDHAMKAYNERLQKAMERDDADEVRHLFKMIGLARDEAVRQRNAINTCMNRPEPDHPVEVRMTNAPAPPPIGEERPGVSPERVPFQVALDAPVDYDSRLTTRWPPPQDVWRPPINAPYHAAVNPNRLEFRHALQ